MHCEILFVKREASQHTITQKKTFFLLKNVNKNEFNDLRKIFFIIYNKMSGEDENFVRIKKGCQIKDVSRHLEG
jgi:hypothetical protein